MIKLALIAALAFAHHGNDPPPAPDTLKVDTQSSSTLYSGHITQFDTEDAVAQVEINDATISVSHQITDRIFYNGFELYNVNWIWVGDDTHDNEFGGAGDCSMDDWHDHDGSFHALLTCYQIENEDDRTTH